MKCMSHYFWELQVFEGFFLLKEQIACFSEMYTIEDIILLNNSIAVSLMVSGETMQRIW